MAVGERLGGGFFFVACCLGLSWYSCHGMESGVLSVPLCACVGVNGYYFRGGGGDGGVACYSF